MESLHPFPGMQHLDVAGGTGDVAFRVVRGIQNEERKAVSETSDKKGTVTVFDINAPMLEEGKKKASSLHDIDSSRMTWVEGNAEQLPFNDNTFDSYTIAFGIRNVTNRDKALFEANRVLKPGGRFLCLEFSKVTLPVLRDIYDEYSFRVIPEIGRVVAGDKDSYQYLVESIRMFPDQETFSEMIREAGFIGVRYENLTAGVVALHSGIKV